jgi:LysM repeat protein
MKLTTTYSRPIAYPHQVLATRTPAYPRRFRLSIVWFLMYVFVALFVVMLPFGLVVGASEYYQISGRILPGVQVGGVPLGGMTPQQAAVEIQRVWNLEKLLTLTDGVRNWPISPADAGLNVDAVKTAQNAAVFGHGSGFGSGLPAFIGCIRNGCQLSPVVGYNPDQARLALETLAPKALIQPVNATIRLEGAQVHLTPGVQGYQLDVQSTLNTWSADPFRLYFAGNLPLVMQPVQPQVSDLSALKGQIESMISNLGKVHGYDPISDEWFEWKPTPEQAANWLRFDEQTGGPQVSVDPGQASAFLAQIDAGLRPERRIDIEAETAGYIQALQESRDYTLIIKHLPTLYTIVEGDTLIKVAWKVGIPYWKILAANPGIDQNALRSGQVLEIPSKDELLPLPVVVNKRIVISISQQRMWTYQDGQQLHEYVISTGIDRSPTQPGIFQVRTHELDAYAELWNLHMPHFLGIYESWPGFMNGIHGLPTLSNGQRLWENVLGRPASYGCIILNLDAAEAVYNWAEDGVVVEIKG